MCHSFVPDTDSSSLEAIESTLRSDAFIGSDGESGTAEYEQDAGNRAVVLPTRFVRRVKR
ncbi:hypothetical protein [Haladaptatus sp. DYF46]|uniref:hypothetical protein n=1 Tax=Haladaptatus sp. DYF46 TaxID=2886041 RepID=UPI001E4DBB66|nr:hypothetical protein [Haladaptatus sp. DYF46]